MPHVENDSFLRACWKKETDYTPVWFMRQAGRYMQSYRKIRSKHDVLTICKSPELAATVALAPVSELQVDAAIIFADIILPLEGMGVPIRLEEGTGPIVERPVRDVEDVKLIGEFQPDRDVPYVLEGIRVLKKQLDGQVPVIGFSGAPFTLASYLIEGRPSRDFIETKRIMYNRPDVWASLLKRLSEIVTKYLEAQVKAGVDAVQLFDSWAGSLSPRDYEEFVLPFTREIFDKLEGKGVPSIHFGTGTAGILRVMKKAGGDVYSIDWRIPIDESWAILGDVAIQGNLDPAALLGPAGLVQDRARDILDRVGGRPGHVFNLGHGVLPETPQDSVSELVEFVHSTTRRRR